MAMALHRSDNHIIKMYLYIMSNLMGENCVHESYVSGVSNLKAGGHDIVVVVFVI